MQPWDIKDRRVWLETYNPELEEPSDEKGMLLAAGGWIEAQLRE